MTTVRRMLYLALAVLLVSTGLGDNGSFSNRGYIVTAPNRFIPGRAEQVCVELSGNNERVTVELSLLKNKNDTEALTRSSVVVPAGGSSGCTRLTAPRLDSTITELTLRARGTEDSYRRTKWSFTDSKQVAVLPSFTSSMLTFIQTDKPIYKPGQLVQFRVLTLDSRLRPVKNSISNVAVVTPSQVTVEQWKNVVTTSGMFQFKFQLSDEPEMGDWVIKIDANGLQEVKMFKVEEYVLPRYEVTITPPKYVTFQSQSVPMEVCAKYTFGKPVKGDVEGKVCMTRQQIFFFERGPVDAGRPGGPPTPQSTCFSFTIPIASGCVTKTIQKQDVKWDQVTQFTWGVNLVFDATVKEKGTGISLNATTVTLPFSQYDVAVTMEGPSKFKPGLAYNGKVMVKKLDDTPAPNKLIEISISNWRAGASYSKNYTSDANGEVLFTIPPVVDDTSSLSIQARALEYVKDFWSFNAPTGFLFVQGWFSPTGSYLQFIPPKGKIECGKTAALNVLYTTSTFQNTKLFIKAVGPGDVVYSSQKNIVLLTSTGISQPETSGDWDKSVTGVGYWWQPPRTSPKVKQVIASSRGRLSIALPISAAMSPQFSLVIYYIRSDGEVVSDNIQLDVAPCTENMANMKFGKDTVLPGEAVDLTLSASPNSLCGYGVVDKSVFLKGGNNQITLREVVDQLVANYGLTSWSGPSEDQNTCGVGSPQPSPTPAANANKNVDDQRFFCGIDKPYKDAADGFKDSGITVMTNLKINVSPCTKQICQFFARGGGDVNGNANRNGAPAPAGPAVPPVAGAPNVPEKIQATDVRTYFPETWLWDLATIGTNGETIIRTKAPDTITEWNGNSLCINDQTGFGISPMASLTTFQPFFVEMTVPYSVIRGEKVPVPLTVSNFLKECLAVQISLLPAEGYTVQGVSSATVCVCGGDSQTQTFTLIMAQIGDVNISINALSVSNANVCPRGSVMSSRIGLTDTVIKPLIVKPEGAPREYTISSLVCLKSASGGDVRMTEQYDLPLPNASSLVKDSARAYVKVVGDVMGPALSNLDNLLQMPGGCGEQNILTMAPNVYVLKYFEAIHKDQPAIREKAIENIKLGYQNELKFQFPDGSYSAWGPNSAGEVGSTWLTAFVTKSFGQARPYANIDSDTLAKSRKFFADHQQADGCFPMLGMVIHKEMLGGISNNEGNIPALTAFVLMAMLETGATADDPSVVKAIQCIDSKQYTDAYTTALTAYAYSLYKPSDPKARTLYNKLRGLAKTDASGAKFWKANENEPVVPVGSWWWFQPVSADVETTAYALLTILRMESAKKIDEGLPVVRWLTKQRNPYGGFGSTQDTIIGIQALAEFAALIYSDGISANVQVLEKISRTNVATFQISQDNSFVEFTRKVTNVVALELQASGHGCFVFQVNVRYNVIQPDTAQQPFVTTATASVRTNGCAHQFVHLCTRYVGEGGFSNMAIIEVKMPSGWVPDVLSLKKIVLDANTGCKKYEIDQDNTIQLYFNKLDGTEKCLDFEMDQMIQVSDLKPAVITTYDYYKKGLRQETTYSPAPC